MFKHLLCLALSLSLLACAGTAQKPVTTEAQDPAPAEAAVSDPAAEAAQLIELSMTNRLTRSVAGNYRTMLEEMMAAETDAPEQVMAIVDDELQKLLARQEDQLVEDLVPVYLDYFTADEIHQLLAFYESDVARKSQELAPEIAEKTRPVLRSWSEGLGDQLLERVTGRLKEAGIEVKK